MTMRVLLAHPGTQHSGRLARQLQARGLLGEFWTGLAFTEGGVGAGLAQLACRLPRLDGIGSRVMQGIPPDRLHTLPLNEVRALLKLRCRADSPAVIHQRNAAFQRAVPDAAIRASDAIIGFDTSSWLLAERAVRFHRPLFLDRTIAHLSSFDRILQLVRNRYPEWGDTVARRRPDVVAAEQQEHDLAHRIVVGSSFVARTLVENGVDAAKIRVNPYGVDWSRFAAASVERTKRPLRFLFAGSLLARKGVPVLLEAWRRLAPRDAELWLVGAAGPREQRLLPELPGLRVIGRARHAAMAGIYAECDVFVLPTFFEGFSLVLLEAVAAGLPVITTPNSGAPEVVTTSPLGRLVETGSADALVAAMRHFIDRPPVRAEVRTAAEALREEFSWDAYGDRWSALLRES